MIIENGYIQAIEVQGGGFTETGSPIATQKVLGGKIGCNIATKTIRRTNTDVEGNAYKVAAYEVLIESQPFHADYLMLTRDETGKSCRCIVTAIVPQEQVNAVKISCEYAD